MGMQLTSDELVKLARHGNRRAMQELYAQHRDRILHLARQYTRDTHDAEDILQETFIRAYSSLQRGSLEKDAYFATWLYRIGINCAIDHLRRGNRQSTDSLPDDHHDENADCPESLLVRDELQRALQEGMQHLSPQQRLVISLKHEKQMKVREIADLLGCSEGSIKKQLFRGLQDLRGRLGGFLRGEA